MEEIWKDIEGYEGLYQVSNLGRVLSKKKNLVLSPHKVNTNYFMVDLYKNTARKKFYIHRLVAQMFIPNPLNLPFVNHKDFNRLNNTLNNLEWCDQSGNMNHAYTNGAIRMGSKRKSTKLTEDQVAEIKKRLKNNERQVKIAEDFGVSFVTISDISRGIYWKHI